MPELMLEASANTLATLRVRPPVAEEMEQIRGWLPQAFWGRPRPQFCVAVDQASRALVGVATLRIFPNAGERGTGYFLIRIDRVGDMGACAGALLNTVLETARARSIGRLESGCVFEETDPCVEVLRGFGMAVIKERLRFHVDSLDRALAHIAPLFRRVQQAGRIPENAWIGGLDQVDPCEAAAFIVEHLSGFPECVLSKLDGSPGDYCRQVSSVVKLGQRIVGVVLCEGLSNHKLLVDRRAVARDCRGGWVNLALMHRGLQEGLRLGYETLELQGDVGQHEDTFKLAKRLEGVQVGREYSFGLDIAKEERQHDRESVSLEHGQETPTKHQSVPLQHEDPAPVSVISRQSEKFAEILEQLGISLVVTTGHTGNLILLRAEQGSVRSHRRNFGHATGLAVDGDRLALGTANQIWEFHNSPAVARRLEPAGSFDACFLPRHGHVTGDIRLHELAWADEELWFTNTRFSCLATRDSRYSFVPRWRPPFISALAPEDRCHMNGLCRAPAGMSFTETPSWFVTALSATDTPEGWRQCLNEGGVLMDTGANEVIVRDLSLPHSPRCYADQLWLLESGRGTAGVVDRSAGRYQPVAELPGFPRGLDFYDRYAFVGLSQMRHFGRVRGIPLTERLGDARRSGVWVLDTVSGETVAFLEFADPIQDVYAVQVLAGRRRVELVHNQSELMLNSFVVPDVTLESVPADYVRRSGERNGQPAHVAVGS